MQKRPERSGNIAGQAWSLEPRLAVAEKERAGLKNAYADVTDYGCGPLAGDAGSLEQV